MLDVLVQSDRVCDGMLGSRYEKSTVQYSTLHI